MSVLERSIYDDVTFKTLLMVNDVIHWMDKGTVWITPSVNIYVSVICYSYIEQYCIQNTYWIGYRHSIFDYRICNYKCKFWKLTFWPFWYWYCWLTKCPPTGNSTYRKLSTNYRLSFYEFAPKGWDFVSVVRIREGFFLRKLTIILSLHRKLSVFERCPNGEVGLLLLLYYTFDSP